MTKIIFSDIDGTLLNSQHQITTKTLEAIKQIQTKGIYFVPISARSPDGIYPLLKQYNFHVPIISFSGSYILDKNENELYSHGFDFKLAKRIITYIKENKFDCTVNIFSERNWYVENRKDKRVISEENIVHTQSTEIDFNDLSLPYVHKFLLMCNPEHILTIEAKLIKQFPEVTITKSSSILIEINPLGISKGKAIETLCKIFQIDIQDTMGFGDNFNDEAMLETVAKPYLMDNAPDLLKQKFTNITLDNNHDGIYHALLKEGLIE